MDTLHVITFLKSFHAFQSQSKSQRLNQIPKVLSPVSCYVSEPLAQPTSRHFHLLLCQVSAQLPFNLPWGPRLRLTPQQHALPLPRFSILLSTGPSLLICLSSPGQWKHIPWRLSVLSPRDLELSLADSRHSPGTQQLKNYKRCVYFYNFSFPSFHLFPVSDNRPLILHLPPHSSSLTNRWNNSHSIIGHLLCARGSAQWFLHAFEKNTTRI